MKKSKRNWSWLIPTYKPSSVNSLLFETGTLAELGAKALAIKQRKYARKVFWVRNLHVNYTNICRAGCRVCGYSKKKGDPEGYVLAIDEILYRVGSAVAAGAVEVHIVGAVNPELKFQYYLGMIGELRLAFPALFIKAYTAVEIHHLAEISGLDIKAVLEKMIRAGLNSLPGGGAEIFSERVRKELFPDKIPAAQWLDIHCAAHELGIRTTATMLFGHIETLPERLEHLRLLKQLQDRTNGFIAFVPLPVVGYGKLTGIDGLDALRTIALCRIVLDNFEHIKVFWPIWGLKLSQLALNYGADDFDGTVGEYKIVDQAGLSPAKLTTLITEAGWEPVERNGRYETPC